MSNIIKAANFEDGDILAGGMFYKWQLQLPPAPGAAIVSDAYSRIGDKSLKLEVNVDQPLVGGSYRNMIYVPNTVAWANTHNQRIGFTSFSNDIPDPKNELIFQYHIKTKTSATAYPVLAIWRTNGKFILRHTFNAVDYSKIDPFKYKEYALGLEVKGKADDWVIIADFKIDKTGVLKIYRNGKLVVDVLGANFNRENGTIQAPPWVSMGMYKFSWPHPAGKQKIPVRTMYYDRILFGSPAATYADFKNY